MKRSISIILSLILFLSFTVIANGQTNTETNLVVKMEYYSDGSYGITRLITDAICPADKVMSFRSTITKSKVYDHYSANNVLLWEVKLTASFTYNGSTASCTNATPSYTMYATTWSVTKSNATYSGNTATGNFTVKRYNMFIPVETVNKTLTLTCSPSGVVT